MVSYANLTETERYAHCLEISKRVRWDIDRDVIRGREFDFTKKFLPDTISRVNRFDFLNPVEQRFISQIQGRTYAGMFGFVERFIVAKILELSRRHWLGNQLALEALIRFCDEELKHQELFRRIEAMIAGGMPPGYAFPWNPNEVAAAVLAKSSWAVLGLIYEIELFTQAHYKESIEPEENLSDLYKDIFLYHWKEETTHALMDAIEWPAVDDQLSMAERDRAVNDLIDLINAVDGILRVQSTNDAEYFVSHCQRPLTPEERLALQQGLLAAYRWQYIFSGVNHKRFQELFTDMTTRAQQQRVLDALDNLA